MAKTTTYSVGSSAVAVTTNIATKTVTIAEDASVASWPTTDFKILAPTSGDTAIQRPQGTGYTFVCPTAFWPAGTVVGYVKAVTGTTTFQQYEDGY